MAESWSWDSPPGCNCETLRLQHPHEHFVDGRLTFGFTIVNFDLFPSPQVSIAILHGFSAAPQPFPLHPVHMACC